MEIRAFSALGARKVSSDSCDCNHCGWSIHGLIPSEASYMFTKDKMRIYHIFTPVARMHKKGK